MKYDKMDKKLKILFLIILSAFLAISFFVLTPFNTDDSGTYLWLHSEFNLGSIKHTFKQRIEPWNLTAQFIYFIGSGLLGDKLVNVCFAIWYGICVFLLFMTIKDVKNKWLILLVAFMLIPSDKTNKYHLVPAAISLLFVYALKLFAESKRKLPLLISLAVLLYGFITINDRVILLMFIAIPLCAYAGIWCLQNVDKQKILYIGMLVIAFVAAGIKVYAALHRRITGVGTDILQSWGGYGGEEYLTWINVYNLFDKGIPSFFSCLLQQYNIPIEGGLIQFNTLFWLIRIAIVLLALAAIIYRWVEIIKKGVANVPFLDAFATIGVTAIIGVNVLNGMIKYYDIENTPMNRYASIAWFLILVILARWIDEKYKPIPIFNINKKQINSAAILAIVMVLLIVGYSKPIYLGRDALTRTSCQTELEYLKSYGDEYRYGIGSFWKSTPIIAMTNGEYNTCSGWVDVDEIDSEKLNLRCHAAADIYNDGSNYFNYMISYVDNNMTISEENIEKIRGDYIKKQYLYDEMGESIVYLYDYDVRFEPKLIMQAVGTNYELVEPIEYHYDLPVGINRIEMQVTNSANFVLNVVDNPDISDVSIKTVDEYKIYVDLKCEQNTTATLQVAKNDDTQTTIHKIVQKRVNAAICLNDTMSDVSDGQVYLKTGEYVFTFAGENLDNLQVIWAGMDINTEQLTDGKMKNRYKVTVNSPQTISYQAVGESIYVEKVSYENEELFEEE